MSDLLCDLSRTRPATIRAEVVSNGRRETMDESMQNRGGLVSVATPGCGSSIASLTHRTAFGPSSPRLRARDAPERGPAPPRFCMLSLPCAPRS